VRQPPAGISVVLPKYGYLTLNNSTIDDNDAFYGAGIFGHFNTGTRLTISGRTISNNRANGGGGINFFSVASTGSAVGTIDRSTISNNSGSAGVRVRYSSANLTITNSTIAYNKGDYGGGLSLTDARPIKAPLNPVWALYSPCAWITTATIRPLPTI
jgi:hypothetical protein